MNEDRAKVAYDTFRNGFTGGTPCPAPAWDAAPSWVRDVVLVAYLQGSLDRGKPAGEIETVCAMLLDAARYARVHEGKLKWADAAERAVSATKAA